ncbi:MAG: TIGR03032 family protein, partial [Schleiferiaceae bacterium]|nr:TIGR03032 family protein [Schleiferiaceae bacterium]
MALENGKPKYVSCFNQGNTAQSWRQNITETGVIIDVDTDELVAEGLAMPHTPKLIDGTLYVLMSATGELVKINTETGEKETILKLDSFVRGMDVCGEFLFIGLSKLRKNSKTFAHLMNNFSRNRAGVAIVHLPSGAFVGEIQYHTSVEEIYEVKVIPNTVRPNILNPESEDCNRAVSIPSTTFWASSNENN